MRGHKRFFLLSALVLASCSPQSPHTALVPTAPAPASGPKTQLHQPRPTPHTLRYPADDAEYYTAPMAGESILSDTLQNSADPYTLVTATQSDGVRYIRYEYRFWAIDTSATATLYDGAQLTTLAAQGVINDSTRVFDDKTAYAYSGILNGVDTEEALLDASDSAPPPPPPAPPPAPGGSCTCVRQTSWGYVKKLYLR